jgi:hypothetical protein
MSRWTALGVVALVVVVGACGDDSGEEEASGSASASPSASASAPASGSGVSECEPVGEGGGTPVEVTLDEWSITAAEESVAAGPVTFEVTNQGEEAHELVVVQADSPDDLEIVDGQVDEAALPEGAFIGEVEGFPAGTDCEGTFELEAASYVLFCNILEEHEGEPESHVEEGMVTTLEVT